MQISGEERFEQSQAEVWARLTDIEFLAGCLPKVESIDRDGSGMLVCRVRPGVSFLKGTLKVTLEILDKRQPDQVWIRVTSRGIGSSATVETAAELLPENPGTRLCWTAEVKERGGLLKPISPALVTASARRVVAEGWAQFRSALERESS